MKPQLCPLLALACLSIIHGLCRLDAQTALPAPLQPRIVDGASSASLSSAFQESCKSGAPLIITSGYPGKEPLPTSACDHHVEVLDLRQADSLTGRLNVKSFGAAGDGKTDDTAAVRATIAYALAHLADKGAPLVYFPAGTFPIKGELRITSQITIAGDGPAMSTIQEVDPKSNLFTITRSRECATGQCLGGLREIALAGNGHLTTGSLIELNDSEDYRFEHLVLFNHGGRGIQINDSSERLDSHDLSITLVRWPIVIAKDANESYFYNTKIMFPGATDDGWCYNINCLDGKYPTQGLIRPDPHAAITAYMPVNVGFYGGSIKSLQMIGGFKAFNTEVTTLDHFYFEFGYVNPGVIAGGVSDWTTTTGELSAVGLTVPVKSTEWMAQYYTSAGDVPTHKSGVLYAIIPPDFQWGGKEPSSLGGGVLRGSYELVGVAGFAGDGTLHIGSDSRGMKNTTPRTWPAGAIVEAYNTGVYGLRVSNSHINEQEDFRPMGAKGAQLVQDCDNTGTKTCAEVIAGYVPDGRWVQQHGSPGDLYTSSLVALTLDNVKMFTGTPSVGLIAVHSRASMMMSGTAGGPSDGETAEVPFVTPIGRISGGKNIEVPTYSNGHRPQFFFYDGNNGRMVGTDADYFTQLASYPEAQGQYLNGRQYANSFSIFDVPKTGKHPLNSFTLVGGPSPDSGQGLRYDHWTGSSWASLFSVGANADNTANVNIDGVMTAKGLRIGDGPVITSLSANGAVATSAPTSPARTSLAGRTGNIGGAPLSAGQCASGSAAVLGASSGMPATTSPASPPGDGFVWQAFVARGNTVTVKVCALAAGTPSPVAYDVRVFP